MSFHTILSHEIPRRSMPSHTTPYYALHFHVSHTMSGLTMSGHAILYNTMPCQAMVSIYCSSWWNNCHAMQELPKSLEKLMEKSKLLHAHKMVKVVSDITGSKVFSSSFHFQEGYFSCTALEECLGSYRKSGETTNLPYLAVQ